MTFKADSHEITVVSAKSSEEAILQLSRAQWRLAIRRLSNVLRRRRMYARASSPEPSVSPLLLSIFVKEVACLHLVLLKNLART